MKIRTGTTMSLALALAAAGPAAAQDKKVIASASDIPPLVIELPKKPSELVLEGGPALDAISDRVEAHVETIVRDYEIRDKTTEKSMRSLLLQIAMAENRWADALRLNEEIRALEDKPSARATSGLLSVAYAKAAMRAEEGTAAFREAFADEFGKAVAGLDWEVTQDAVQALRGQFQLISRDLIVGSLQGGADANAAAQENKVGFGMGAGLVSTRMTLEEILPLKDVIFATLDKRVQAEATEKKDLWTQRLVTLEPAEVKQPVVVAVWDSGIDPAVFEGRLWTNEDETPNGKDDDGNGFVDDVHGIAFDTRWKPSTAALRPMPGEDMEGLGETMRLVKGSLDLQAAVDSPEADALRKAIGGLKPAEVMPFQLKMGRVGLYLHGTATGFTSVEGNPAARVMHSRFDYDIQPVPVPIDEEMAEAIAQHARDSVAYFKANGARVANMSWRITEPQIAGSLASIESDPEKRKARAKKIFDIAAKGVEEAIASAPDILFVAGAGNEDEDVDFVRSFPAGLNLPNLLTVGAVDVALQPAAFTSYGKSIDVYANGFEVPSKVPGGMPINISGTSLAAPYVTNLAAKLLAVNPGLKVVELRAIIEGTATAEGERRLKVIHPAAALARAKK